MSTKNWLAEAFAENPNQIFEVDPNGMDVIIDPARNARGYTPEVGDKSLSSLMEQLCSIGQQTPCFATLDSNGIASLYAGFRRARSIQTIIHDMQATADSDTPLLYEGGKELPLLKVLITPTQLTDLQVFERSLSENVFREGLTPMQKVNALLTMTGEPHNLSLAEAGKKLNLSKGAASIYRRFALLPVAAKAALDSGKLSYPAAEQYLKMLPSASEIEAEGGDELLKKGQDKIAAHLAKQLAGSKKVKTKAVEKMTRNSAKSDGTAANKTQRKAGTIITEIDEQVGKLKEIEGKAAERACAALAAFKKYVSGGTMRTLLKALEG